MKEGIKMNKKNVKENAKKDKETIDKYVPDILEIKNFKIFMKKYL